MEDELEELLERRWPERPALRDGDAAYDSALRLAEIDNCLAHQRVAGPRRQAWSARVRAAWRELDVDRVLEGAAAAVKRLRWIFGIGTEFVYEELMLAVTMRVQLDLLLAFLDRRDIEHGLASEVEALDETLRAIAESKKHRGPFSSAQAAARRNWGLPLETRWLGASQGD